MIEYSKFTLQNGLTVIVHNDKTTPMVAVNLLYNVGARDENPEMTGFAHLFEHLMFEGSVNIPHYDKPLQQAGGENNAYTNNNITNYYITLPVQNIETAFWLESDRMLGLAFSQKKLDIQKKVVIEEFKQRYLNQPYGDWNLLLRPLAYKVHPYMWPTIGKCTEHVEQAALQHVEQFFYSHYAPNNAILSVAGNVTVDQIKALAQKWFGNIEPRQIKQRNIPPEPLQTSPRTLNVERKVPFDAIFKAYHMPQRLSPDYYATDLISDILSNGKSSRLVNKLVNEQKLFSHLSAYITGDIDPGLFIITGNISKGVSFDTAENALQTEIELVTNTPVDDYELTKVKNKIESALVLSELSVLNKAMNLAYFELLGDAGLINSESNRYNQVTPLQLNTVAKNLFNPNNCSTLYYKAIN